MEKLKDNVTELKKLTDELAGVIKSLDEKKTEYESSIKELEEKKVELSTKIASTKVLIEADVLVDFKTTANKSYYGGIGVQERKKITYDSAIVFAWAKVKGMFIVLDSKAFEKSAEAMIAADPIIAKAVKITKEPQVTYPKEIKLED